MDRKLVSAQLSLVTSHMRLTEFRDGEPQVSRDLPELLS